MVRFDLRRDGRTAFDDVGIKRSLREKIAPFQFVCVILENAHKLLADNLALLFRVRLATQSVEKPITLIEGFQVWMKMLRECLDDLLRFVLSQQAMIDEN